MSTDHPRPWWHIRTPEEPPELQPGIARLVATSYMQIEPIRDGPTITTTSHDPATTPVLWYEVPALKRSKRAWGMAS